MIRRSLRGLKWSAAAFRQRHNRLSEPLYVDAMAGGIGTSSISHWVPPVELWSTLETCHISDDHIPVFNSTGAMAVFLIELTERDQLTIRDILDFALLCRGRLDWELLQSIRSCNLNKHLRQLHESMLLIDASAEAVVAQRLRQTCRYAIRRRVSNAAYIVVRKLSERLEKYSTEMALQFWSKAPTGLGYRAGMPVYLCTAIDSETWPKVTRQLGRLRPVMTSDEFAATLPEMELDLLR